MGQQKGKQHWNWKGDKIGYGQIHVWHNKYCKKSGICNQCKKRNRTEWALIKGKKHSRRIDHYFELCIKCHRAYDAHGAWNKGLRTYRNCDECKKEFYPRRKSSRFCSNKCSGLSRYKNKVGLWLKLNSHDPTI